MIDENTAWSFEKLKNTIDKKLKYLAFIKGNKKTEDGKIYYKYTSIELLMDFNFDAFLEALENGEMVIDIRIGINSHGRTHDHGTAFRIKYQNLLKYVKKLA